jgi:hypothetical protein
MLLPCVRARSGASGEVAHTGAAHPHRDRIPYWRGVTVRPGWSPSTAAARPQSPPYSTATDPEPMNSVLLVLSCGSDEDRGRIRVWL